MSEIRFSIETTYEGDDEEIARRVTDRYTIRGSTHEFESVEIVGGDAFSDPNARETTSVASYSDANAMDISPLGALIWFAEVARAGSLERRMLAQALRDSAGQNEIRRDNTRHIEVPSDDYEGKGDGQDETCTICSDTLKAGERISTLSCRHTFHRHCIEEWGHYKAECPLCKKSIPLVKENLAKDKDGMEESNKAME